MAKYCKNRANMLGITVVKQQNPGGLREMPRMIGEIPMELVGMLSSVLCITFGYLSEHCHMELSGPIDELIII